MNVRQLSVVIDNRTGSVSEITDVLGRQGVDIRGFSVSDTADGGVVRLIVDDPDGAVRALQDAGFSLEASDVLCVDLPDHPGGLAGVLKTVAGAGVDIQYVYSLISTYVVINVDDVDSAAALLEGHPVGLVCQETIALA